MKRTLLLFSFLLLNEMIAGPVAMADRVALFDVIGENTLTSVQSPAVTPASCIISITNVGTVSQDYSITVYAAAYVSHVRTYATASGGYNPGTYSGTLANTAGSNTVTYIYTYPSFNSVGTQTLQCSGSIVAVSPSSGGDVGVLIASGTLTSFRQTNAGRGTDLNAQTGFVVHSTVPIQVGGGKTF